MLAQEIKAKMHSHLIKKGARLTDAQKKQLAEHQSKGKHTSKHMASMRMSMLKGHSFKEAHAQAMKKYK